MVQRADSGEAPFWAVAQRPAAPSSSTVQAMAAAARSDARSARVVLSCLALAFAAATCAPMVPFVLGPVLLGVPHVAAGARHLVLRRAFSSSWQCVLLGGAAGLFALRLAREFGGAQLTRLETALVLSWVAAAILSAVRERPAWGRALVAAGVLVLAGAAAWRWPSGSRLAMLHLHNLVAIVALLPFGPRLGPLRWPLFASLAAAALLASGVLYRSTLVLGASAFGLHVLQAADWVAPGLPTEYAVGLTTAYVFLQLVHYAIWLYVIPRRDLAEEAGTTLPRQLRALYRDLKLPGALLFALALLAMVAGSCIHLQSARALYLSLATFHVYLEVVSLARHWVSQGGVSALPAASRA